MCRGYLLRWTKGFDLQDGIGTDPVQSLCDALKQRGCCGNVAALLNDGIGVFGAGRYLCSETAVSFILGTGVYRTSTEYWFSASDSPGLFGVFFSEAAMSLVQYVVLLRYLKRHSCKMKEVKSILMSSHQS